MVSDEFYYGRALSIAIGITMLALLLAGGASAATLTVNANGSADYIKIQDAVNAASTGDIIEGHSRPGHTQVLGVSIRGHPRYCSIS